MQSLPAVLERFHRALIDEIRTQRPEYLDSPFTVAEIYQQLVPYGSHRDRIGVEMNGDYEDALLRLLAGEGGFLVLESEPAVRDLKAELESLNPNTGLYRRFAGVDVRLNPEFLDRAADSTGAGPDVSGRPETDVPAGLPEARRPEGSMAAEQLGIVPPGVDIFADPVPEASSSSSVSGGPLAGLESHRPRPPLAPEFVSPAPDAQAATGTRDGTVTGPRQMDMLEQEGGTCPACRGPLPQKERLNFCPFCGTDLAILSCSACGEELDTDWRFCAFCGQEAGG